MGDIISPKTILEISEDDILIQLEGLEHLLHEEDEGLLSFEITQQFVDEVAEDVKKQLAKHNRDIYQFWGIWSNILYSAVEDVLVNKLN